MSKSSMLPTTNWDIREGGPYDAIIVGASVPEIPQSLVAQLKRGGRMVIPVGQIRRQRIATVIKGAASIEVNYGLDCVFVPAHRT